MSTIDSNPITRTRGDTAADRFTIGQDVTGYSFRLTVNRVENPTDMTNQLLQMQGSIVDATTGVIDFIPSIPDSSALTAGDFFYDIQAYRADTQLIKTIVKSTYSVIQDITKNSD